MEGVELVPNTVGPRIGGTDDAGHTVESSHDSMLDREPLDHRCKCIATSTDLSGEGDPDTNSNSNTRRLKFDTIRGKITPCNTSRDVDGSGSDAPIPVHHDGTLHDVIFMLLSRENGALCNDGHTDTGTNTGILAHLHASSADIAVGKAKGEITVRGIPPGDMYRTMNSVFGVHVSLAL